MTAESHLLTWTVESNDKGEWAAFVRLKGHRTRVSPWYPTAEAVVLKMAIPATETDAETDA